MLGAEGAPQPGDQRLQGVLRIRRARLAPDLLDQRPRLRRPPLPQRERGRQRTQPRAREGHGPLVVAEDERAAEDPEAHPHILTHAPARP